MEEKRYESIRMSFNGKDTVWIRRNDGDDRAVIYTNILELKEELRNYQTCYPKLVNILVDDDMMEAVVCDLPELRLYFRINPVNGYSCFMVYELYDGEE